MFGTMKDLVSLARKFVQAMSREGKFRNIDIAEVRRAYEDHMIPLTQSPLDCLQMMEGLGIMARLSQQSGARATMAQLRGLEQAAAPGERSGGTR